MTRIARGVAVGVMAGWLSACGADGASPGARDGGLDPRDRDAALGDPDPRADAGLPELGDARLPPLPERDGPVRDASAQADALAAANEVLSTFVAQGTTLELDADGCANMEHVAARIGEVTGSDGASGCATLDPGCEGTTGQLTATFDACPLGDSGSTLSGTIEASASTDDAGVTVRLVLTAVNVTTASASYALAGELSTTTSDLAHYAFLADLSVDGRGLTFDGSVATEQDVSGALLGANFEGSGTVASEGAAEELGSWSCAGEGVTFTLAGFHRAVGACRADAGTMTVAQTYACTTTVTVRGQDKEIEAAASVSEVATWSEATSTTQTVHVVTTTTIAGESSEAERDVTLPGECPAAP